MRNVVISNIGPGPIKIEIQGRNARGHFEQQAEHVLKEGQNKVLTLAEFASAQLIALPAEKDPLQTPPDFKTNIV